MIRQNHGLIFLPFIFVLVVATSIVWVSGQYRMCKQLEKNRGIKCEWSLVNK